jgi:hypothetical protein
MAVRGRPSSGVPSEVARKLAEKAGIDLTDGGSDDTAQNRESGLGALLGA